MFSIYKQKNIYKIPLLLMNYVQKQSPVIFARSHYLHLNLDSERIAQ